jgi:rifampicin phosphotransferase
MASEQGRDVRVRQRAIAREREERVAAVGQSLDPIRRRLFHGLLGWAQRYGPYREQALFYMGAGWPTLRRLALELGRRLAQAGTLATPRDIFLLTTAEIERASAARRAGRAGAGAAGAGAR